MATTRTKGIAAEELAARHLQRAGLTILDRNVSLDGAELDLVAREGEAVIFVEVRSRAESSRGHPLETVNARKQARVRRAATSWLVRRHLWERVAVRFDVIAIVGRELEWLENAF